MNGEELLRSMSYVEERFVEEAQAAPAVKKLPWMRIGAMAACFALVLMGAGFWISAGGWKANSEADILDNVEMEHYAPMETWADIGYLEDSDSKVPMRMASLLVRIDTWQENGFTATVDGIVDTDIFPVGTVLTVEFEENIRIVQTDGEVISCTRRTPTKEDFPAGSTVQVMFHIRDGVIFAEQIGTEDAF